MRYLMNTAAPTRGRSNRTDGIGNERKTIMATTADIPRLEMLQVADMVAREKGIEREEVLEAMEQAIQKAGRAKYGLEHDIRAAIDRKTGEIRLARYRQVADPIENEFTQITPKYAVERDPSLK